MVSFARTVSNSNCLLLAIVVSSDLRMQCSVPLAQDSIVNTAISAVAVASSSAWRFRALVEHTKV
jgi:hypothetical protein